MKPVIGKLPINTWMLYRARFICAADICGAWSSFGGIVAQFNNPSIILHIDTAESIAAALLCDSLIAAHLEELARARQERADAQVYFYELLYTEKTRCKIQAAAQAAKPGPPVDPPAIGKKPNGPKDPTVPKGKPPGWLPKREYLANLAAGRKDRQDAAKEKRISAHRILSRTPKRRDQSNRRAHSNQRDDMKRRRRRN